MEPLFPDFRLPSRSLACLSQIFAGASAVQNSYKSILFSCRWIPGLPLSIIPWEILCFPAPPPVFSRHLQPKWTVISRPYPPCSLLHPCLRRSGISSGPFFSRASGSQVLHRHGPVPLPRLVKLLSCIIGIPHVLPILEGPTRLTGTTLSPMDPPSDEGLGPWELKVLASLPIYVCSSESDAVGEFVSLTSDQRYLPPPGLGLPSLSTILMSSGKFLEFMGIAKSAHDYHLDSDGVQRTLRDSAHPRRLVPGVKKELLNERFLKAGGSMEETLLRTQLGVKLVSLPGFYRDHVLPSMPRFTSRVTPHSLAAIRAGLISESLSSRLVAPTPYPSVGRLTTSIRLCCCRRAHAVC